MTRLLIVDGDGESATGLRALLAGTGYEVVTAATAHDAIDVATSQHVDLILLELVLPDGSGEHVLHTVLSSHPDTRIMVVSAVTDAGRLVGALAMGAVDFIAKPCAPVELLARVQARLRDDLVERAAGGPDADDGGRTSVGSASRRDVRALSSARGAYTLAGGTGSARPAFDAEVHAGAMRPVFSQPATVGATAIAYQDDLRLDAVHRTLFMDGREVELSQREFVLMSHLMHRRGQICTRRELLADVWGVDFDAKTNVVDVYIRRLRCKLTSDTIDTIRNIGYRLNAR